MRSLLEELKELSKNPRQNIYENFIGRMNPAEAARYKAREIIANLPFKLRSNAFVGNKHVVVYSSSYQPGNIFRKDRVAIILRDWAKRKDLKVKLEAWSGDEESGTHLLIYGW